MHRELNRFAGLMDGMEEEQADVQVETKVVKRGKQTRARRKRQKAHQD